MRVVVGRIGRAHGIRGEVAVEVRTDEPDERFAMGATLVLADDRPPGQLTVASHRWHSGRLLVGFEGVADRTAAEALRGRFLESDVDPAATPDEPDTFYDRKLVGLRVVAPEGLVFGVVSEVVHLPGQDLLAVRSEAAPAEAEPVLVPFVAAIVPHVDLDGGRVVVTPPPGLFGEGGDPAAQRPDAAAADLDGAGG